MSASEWFGEITNPESIAAITAAATAFSGVVYAFGKVIIDLYKKWKSGKLTLVEAFKQGEEHILELQKKIKSLDTEKTDDKKGNKKFKK